MQLPAFLPILLLSALVGVQASPLAVLPYTTTSPSSTPSVGPPTRTRPTSFAGPSATPLRVPAGLKLRAAAAAAAPDPQETCENSGTGNTGCNNSGINNTGTNNSGINNCGTGQSGIGEGCDDDDDSTVTFVGVTTTVNGGAVVIAAAATNTDATVYTTILTGATSTVTLIGDGRNRRVDCAYWEAQGYVCSGAVGKSVSLLAVALAAVVTGAWLVVG
ncbi:hypothetical protein BZA05DRAFT_83199 [Tricharina praecox]|uniref:uncharacterized protein n=1 Tax=Tricharina praecox TaxID=43433 RepID=UPI00221F6FE8|nr:uncharacterized protein BZA05DRAFT_83199 [Tricharina praecox]KAI5849117.1 hypothetical protein BZA05DRAFT_83199 [Tricharina praecox]